ncbi:MAG: aminodeoxychorismate synthase component I [Bacteroidota bacterium]
MNKSDAIYKINRLALKKIPFLFVIDFDMKDSMVLTHEETESEGIKYNFTGKTEIPFRDEAAKKILFKKHPVSYEKYLLSFNKIITNINNGNTYLLNLTLATRIETNLTLEEIYNLSRAKYKLLIPGKFVVFSPETFVRIKKGKIYSYPMKGTIDAAIENAEEKILNDQKEFSEHTTIVDLIRNDLSMVARNVSVEKFRYIDEISTNEKKLLQVSSVISGELPHNYLNELGELIFALLPAGSVTGAPKKKTIQIIKETEGYERGYYTGVCGYFDGENLESAVMIRFIENIDGTLYYKSGGGITFQSDPQLEYQELIDKVYVPII